MASSSRFTFIDLLSHKYASQAQLLEETERLIAASITKMKASDPDRRIFLVLDDPDTLLATCAVSAQALRPFVLRLRALVHSTVIICAADLPLIAAGNTIARTQPTPLELETASFIVAQAHSAWLVISASELQTGAAKDVSGVLRITQGGGVVNLDGDQVDRIDDSELLYLIQRDGTPKVFNRGSDAT